jgi:hypothetical protein
MSQIVLQQLGVLGLAILFSITLVAWNSRKPKRLGKAKTKPDTN